jgi:hypothetical protein
VEVFSIQVDQVGYYVLSVKWALSGFSRYQTGLKAAPGWAILAIRWIREGLGVQKEARIEVEVRNYDTYNATNPNQKYIIRDILDTVANGVGGVDLIGHQGQKHLAGQPTSRHLNGVFRYFKYNPGVLVSSASLTA